MLYSRDDEFLHGLINSLKAPVFVKNREHRWLLLNDAMCSLFGVPRERLIGKSDYDFFPPEQAEVFWATDEAVFTSGIPNENEELFTDDAGAVYSIITRKSLFHLSDGEPILVGLIIDVTSQRRVERLLDEKEKWLDVAVDGADLGLWDWQILADRLVYNNHWNEMLGYEAHELQGSSLDGFIELLHEEDRDRVRQALDKYVRGESPGYSVQIRVRKKEGEYCWVLSRGSVVERDAAGRAVRMAGTYLDISQVKHNEQQLHARLNELKLARERLERQALELTQARQAAESASRSKSEFLAVMSHEIRTPMTGVLGMAELLKEGELSSDQHDLVQNIIFSGKILLTVVNDILDLSKIEAGKVELCSQPFDLRALVEGLEKMLSTHAQGAGVELSLALMPETPRWVVGDSTRLQQILTNLLANSIKFTPAGGSVLLNVKAQPDHAGCWRIMFDVFDSGIGIREEDQARILNPFEQADVEGAAGKGGTGLGLAIANQLIRLMGGELLLHSKEGAGSTFSFCLLLREVVAHVSPAFVRETQEVPVLRPLRILVAEDNLVNQKLIERLLTLEGHTVTMVENGEEAVRTVREQDFDVVLMDIQMPIMDGESATRAIKQDPSFTSLPIIALTAHALMNERATYLAAGMDGYVSKPINRRHLFEEIGRVIKVRESARS